MNLWAAVLLLQGGTFTGPAQHHGQTDADRAPENPKGGRCPPRLRGRVPVCTVNPRLFLLAYFKKQGRGWHGRTVGLAPALEMAHTSSLGYSRSQEPVLSGRSGEGRAKPGFQTVKNRRWWHTLLALVCLDRCGAAGAVVPVRSSPIPGCGAGWCGAMRCWFGRMGMAVIVGMVGDAKVPCLHWCAFGVTLVRGAIAVKSSSHALPPTSLHLDEPLGLPACRVPMLSP